MRLYFMMKDLIDKADYISIEDFIQKYNVSKRTIQNDLSYLMRVSLRKGFRIHMKRGQGYLLETTNEELLKEFLQTLNNGFFVPTHERPAYILAFLSTQGDYVSMDSIANMFQVSKTVIKNDMKDVEELAHGYHFEIERKHHYGVKIISSDTYMKAYLLDEYLNQNFFIETAINDVVKDDKEVTDYFLQLLNDEGLNMNYNELMNVSVYLKVMVYMAFLNGERDEKFVYQDSTLHSIAKGIIKFLKDYFHVPFSKESINDLIHILTMNVRRRMESITFNNHLEEDIEVFLKKTDEVYNTSFLNDEDFKKMLLMHVLLLVDRLHDKISYKNELANELSITYPMIFNIAIQFCEMLQQKYNVESTFDEIAFVAMHFAGHMEKEKQAKLDSFSRIGVVCSSGAGSAYMIKLQIESLFPTSKVQTFSFLQQKDLLDYQPDLIFTVMPLSFDVQVPVIYIKELLNDKDMYRIRQMLQMEEYDSYTLMNDNPIYQTFFSKKFFQMSDDHDYHHLIQEMAHELEEKGYGKVGYADKVLERESYVSTIYLNGVCIPHPIETDALRSMISVRILNKPFVDHGKDVKIVFMICIKKEQIAMYKEITTKLYQLMKDTKYLDKILKAKSFEEMIAVMNEMDGVNNV